MAGPPALVSDTWPTLQGCALEPAAASEEAGPQWAREVALNCSWEEQPQGAGHQAGSCLVSGLVSNSQF